MTNDYQSIEGVELGDDIRLGRFINLYGCKIGDCCTIGAFVEIQKNATIGHHCKISSHSFVCEGVIVAENCFIGHGVMFINDKKPRSVNSLGELEADHDWISRLVKTEIGRAVSIGSNATIMGGVTIGDNALVGAGSVVTKSIPANQVWAGNPARFLRYIDDD
ncbi:transferase family hexapeptide repeat protein [Sinobacterium caligoides]|uniref:Transferase family hexapeptide repeat protein n=1 Tax=Sinobacterium caligoides TaxID=933926 RepID=A0A3N2DJZ0_9GAMM|nr:acyltransferase [Sinobacterium caligoides]ROS00121.1 transferase family hexapeptide repeat protein [Sinobacterium caligoides]